MQKKSRRKEKKMSRKKKLSGAFAVAAGAVVVTGSAVMAHTPSAHAETPTVAVQKTDEAKQGEEKQNTVSLIYGARIPANSFAEGIAPFLFVRQQDTPPFVCKKYIFRL